MKLYEFKSGDKVRVPLAVPVLLNSPSATVKYVGKQMTLLESEFGTEFTLQSDLDGFRYFQTEDELDDQITRLTVLGRDLIAAIELSIPHHTPGLTLHMQDAIGKFREELRHV